jgi:peptide/nickel transport system permease protein
MSKNVPVFTVIVTKIWHSILGFFQSLGKFFKIILTNKKSLAGFIILILFFLMATIGKYIFPYDPATDYANRFASMSWEHPLGTDNMGRDLFRMMVAGSNSVLSIALLTALFTVAIGTVIGIVSGLCGKWVDKILMLITNVVLTLPQFPILLILSALFTIDNVFQFALILSLFGWGGLARAVRSQIISLKERDFIQICRVLDLSVAHITFKELLPNIMSFISINFILIMRGAITASVGIMVLGLADFDPTNWGAILLNAKDFGSLIVPQARVYLFTPIVFIMIFQLGAILFSNGLDEAINPRLREN